MRQGNKSKIRSPELHALYKTEEESALSENGSSKANMVSKDCCAWECVLLTWSSWWLELEPDNLSARMAPLCLPAEEQRKTALAPLAAKCLISLICFAGCSESYRLLLHPFGRRSWGPATGLQASLLGWWDCANPSPRKASLSCKESLHFAQHLGHSGLLWRMQPKSLLTKAEVKCFLRSKGEWF